MQSFSLLRPSRKKVAVFERSPGLATMRRWRDSNPRRRKPPVFKTGAIDRYATPPRRRDIIPAILPLEAWYNT